MLQLLFHVLRKISCKVLEMVREICVQVREKVRDCQETYLFFLQIFGGNPVTRFFLNYEGF